MDDGPAARPGSMTDTPRRRLELAAPPSQVMAQLRAQLDPQLALEVASPQQFCVRQVSGARVRGQVESAGDGARMPLAALCVGVCVAVAVGLAVAAARREERRDHDVPEIVGAVERALQPMLSSGTGIPYRALPAGEAPPAPRAAERVEFSPAWDRRVPAPAEAVTAHLRASLGIPGLMWVEAAADGWLAVKLQYEGHGHELLVAVRPREDGSTLEAGFRHGTGILGLVAWVVVVLGGSAALGRFGLVTTGVLAVASLIFIGVAAATSDAGRQHLLGTLTRRIEQVLLTLPDPRLQGSSDRALGTGAKGQGEADTSDG